MSRQDYIDAIAKKRDEKAGKIAQALEEKKRREEAKEDIGLFPAEVEPSIVTLDDRASMRCSTINEVRIYLFGMRDVLDQTPDNDYEQGQLSVINKLLDATREDS